MSDSETELSETTSINTRPITAFFQKAKSIEETIPSVWRTLPKPTTPKKRPVGRPRKSPYPLDTTKDASAPTNMAIDLDKLQRHLQA